MPSVVPPRALSVVPHLLLRQAPGVWIDDRRHRDGNPLFRRSQRMAGALAQPWARRAHRQAGMDPVHRTVPVVPGFALVGRAGEDTDDCTLRPAAPAPLARRDAALDQPLLDRIGAQLLLDQPTIHLAHHRRLTLLDNKLLRTRLGPAQQAIAVGRCAAPVDPSLTSPEQTSPSGPLRDQGAFVLSEHALHLQQHLLLRAGAEG